MSARPLIGDGLVWQAGGRRIVDDISIHARPGAVTGLIGPNGSGKTSLLRLLAGVVRPDSGRVSLGKVDVHRISARQRARSLALVEQETATTLDLLVREVVELGRVPHRSRFGTGDESGPAIVEAAMRAAGVDRLADRRWQTLSGGERQRSHLARTLAQEPEVLLLDEPTNHLDLRHQLAFLEGIRDLGITVVAVLHDLEFAAAYCDEVGVLDAGRLVALGPVGDILTAGLVAEVYGVDVTVETHPVTGRPHVRWNGLI
ncbi:MAG: ABC transporter ATP-binding protein [Nocardioides sp.]|uniref:ABC transporter ATP-binding protein n=1 Tax=Nocardioides sp. TaxID=35761 RepID=UPI0039E416F5